MPEHCEEDVCVGHGVHRVFKRNNDSRNVFIYKPK